MTGSQNSSLLRPLQDMRVLVTRPKDQAEELLQRLDELGARSVAIEAISVAPPPSWVLVDKAIRDLDGIDWVVFTSVNGVRFFTERLKTLGVPVEKLAQACLAAVGPATGRALAEVCREPDAMPESFLTDAVVEVLGNVEGKSVLLPRADIASKKMARELTGRGARVIELAVYQVRESDDQNLVEKLRCLEPEQRPDCITLTSPSSARGIHKLLRRAELEHWFSDIPLICIGPVTAQEVEALGVRPAQVASTFTTEGLIEALTHFRCHQKASRREINL